MTAEIGSMVAQADRAMGPIDERIQVLNKVISQLDSVSVRLIEQIAPVLNNRPISEEAQLNDKVAEVNPESSVASNIRSAEHRILNIVHIIENATKRVDL